MKKKTPSEPFVWDRFSLYELCAQNPPRDARLLRAIWADGRRSSKAATRRNLILGEDFGGTGALSRAWCDLLPRGRAVAVDWDAATIARARERGRQDARLRLVRSDVHLVREKADLIAVLNFSICELHTRAALVKYFRHARSRLRPGGCLICDVYGGVDAFQTGMLDQRIRAPQLLPDGTPHPARRDRITYSWEQRSADPFTGRVVNAMHFDVLSPAAAKPFGIINAFVYDWRLWSVPELREGMLEAGFKRTDIYPRTAEATDSEGNLYVKAVDDPTEIEESFNVFVVGRG